MSGKSSSTGVLLAAVVCAVAAWLTVPVSAQEPAGTVPGTRRPAQDPDQRRVAPRPVQRPADEHRDRVNDRDERVNDRDARMNERDERMNERDDRMDETGRPFVRASRLIHAKVTDPEGDHIGDMANLAINTQHGQVVYGVLGTGGFLRMGEKNFAVPWQAVEVRTGDRVVVDVDKSQLKRMAGFRGNAWPAVADSSFARGRSREDTGAYAQAGAEEYGENQPTYNAKGSSLIGRDVLNMQGDKLGTIRDLVIDQQTGRVRYAVIGSGGFLRIGDRLLPTPWSALDTRNDKLVRLSIEQSRLETAPTFSNNDWSALADPDFIARIHAFYGSNQGERREMREPQRDMQRRTEHSRPNQKDQRDDDR